MATVDSRSSLIVHRSSLITPLARSSYEACHGDPAAFLAELSHSNALDKGKRARLDAQASRLEELKKKAALKEQENLALLQAIQRQRNANAALKMEICSNKYDTFTCLERENNTLMPHMTRLKSDLDQLVQYNERQMAHKLDPMQVIHMTHLSLSLSLVLYAMEKRHSLHAFRP